MTTYNTGNPIGSKDPRDLYDNAENLDEAVNTRQAESWNDRFGVARKTWHGMEEEFNLSQENKETRFSSFLESSGYQLIGDYEAGLVINERNQVFIKDGNLYRPVADLVLPYQLSGDWASEENSFVVVGDNSLRQQLSIATVDGLGVDMIGGAARYVNIKDYGAVSGQNSQSAIQLAINDAKNKDMTVWWPAGIYLSSSNIESFWDVKHEGRGVIEKLDGSRWHITPRGSEQNTLWVSNPSSPLNDGMSKGSAIPAQNAFNNLSTIGSKSTDGNWIVKLSGLINHNGVRLVRPLPIFKNRLQIVGDGVVNGIPQAVWDGSTSSNNYAIRIERDTADGLFLLLKDIKFTNWHKGLAQSGAVVVWDGSTTRCENIHIDGAGVGLWFNKSDVVVEGGVIENCTTRGISIEYLSKFNVGRADRAYGVHLKNCNNAVQIGRGSFGYVQGCVFENNRVNISPSRLSRWRCRNNLHKNWEYAAYDSTLSAVFTPDNNSGLPDIFEHSDPNAQVYVTAQGSSHMHIERFGYRAVHAVSDGSLIDINNRPNESVLLSDTGGPSFVPFRLPAFALKNQKIKIDLEIYVLVSAGAMGTLYLNGSGAGETVRMASMSLPLFDQNRTCKITMTVYRQDGLNTVRYRSTLESIDGVVIQSGTTANVNHNLISSHSESQLLYRLYWEPENSENVRFYAMRSYVEY